MWSHTMTVQDYQDLIDRGWRRSGKYVYKPIMNKTCCPQYTIRERCLQDREPMDLHCGDGAPRDGPKAHSFEVERPVFTETSVQEAAPKAAKSETPLQEPAPSPSVRGPTATPKPGVGADPNRPQCRKAKELRKERRLQKEQLKKQEGGAPSGPTPTTALSPQAKTLEEFVVESLPDNAIHNLEVRLVRSNPPSSQFKASFDASYQVYKLYQMAIHKDPPDKPSESQVRGWHGP
ncbi:hypothetical protein Z043_103734 [Scleropages formosus]|uniref:N-end aminoacyl transferase N-terminal domain-containing protein n=1 Tax=Scleropages formosus TaxID=113540 RepID=A0A0P7V5E1_SCLFO|nr:hypothetical protein Z043_103734 [Scleropages formosus]